MITYHQITLRVSQNAYGTRTLGIRVRHALGLFCFGFIQLDFIFFLGERVLGFAIVWKYEQKYMGR